MLVPPSAQAPVDMTDNRARVPLDDIQSYNVLIGPQRNSVLEERSKPKPLDPESIERRVQRSRRTIQAIRDKAKIAAETHAQAQITEIEATVTQEKDKRLFTITKRKEEALLKLHQIFAKEQALIETTFHMRLTEHELLAQQWTTQAEKIAFERRIQEQEKDEKHEKHKMTRQMTLAEQMLQEQADNLQSAKLNELKEAEDDPLRILGLRTRTPGEDSAAPFLATAVPLSEQALRRDSHRRRRTREEKRSGRLVRRRGHVRRVQKMLMRGQRWNRSSGALTGRGWVQGR